MTTNEQNTAIAEKCGWRFENRHGKGTPYAAIIIVTGPNGQKGSLWPDKYSAEDLKYIGIPDYVNDLNAMHEAEELCIRSLAMDTKYVHMLEDIASKQTTIYTRQRSAISATATQRAEAFLRCLGLWKD